MGTWPVRQTCFRTRWMQIMSICKQEAAFNGWSFCILIQSSQSDGIRSIESSEYLSSTQTFVHRKTAVPDTFFFEGIVCLRGQGSGYDLSSKRQCSVLQPIARTDCVRYCSWAVQRTEHNGVLLYLSGKIGRIQKHEGMLRSDGDSL